MSRERHGLLAHRQLREGKDHELPSRGAAIQFVEMMIEADRQMIGRTLTAVDRIETRDAIGLRFTFDNGRYFEQIVSLFRSGS